LSGRPTNGRTTRSPTLRPRSEKETPGGARNLPGRASSFPAPVRAVVLEIAGGVDGWPLPGPTPLMARVPVPRDGVGALRIRKAAESDLPVILDLYNFYVKTSPATFDLAPVSVEERQVWFAEHAGGGRHRLLVAEDDGTAIAGWAATSPFRPRPAYATTVESSVYVRPDAVGRGVGSRLYEDLFRAIQNEDVERIVAGVVVPNPASIALHRRFGFRHVGTLTRVGRKFDRYWDVAWFERARREPEPKSATARKGNSAVGRTGRARDRRRG